MGDGVVVAVGGSGVSVGNGVSVGGGDVAVGGGGVSVGAAAMTVADGGAGAVVGSTVPQPVNNIDRTDTKTIATARFDIVSLLSPRWWQALSRERDSPGQCSGDAGSAEATCSISSNSAASSGRLAIWLGARLSSWPMSRGPS